MSADCGPNCGGCDPCVCGHRWEIHDGKCTGSDCDCTKFDSLFKVRVFYPWGDR